MGGTGEAQLSHHLMPPQENILQTFVQNKENVWH